MFRKDDTVLDLFNRAVTRMSTFLSTRKQRVDRKPRHERYFASAVDETSTRMAHRMRGLSADLLSWAEQYESLNRTRVRRMEGTDARRSRRRRW